jgi:cytochrome P450
MTTDVKWPAWEDAAFYAEDAETMYPSLAVQRHEAPVYWYEPPGYPTGFWVLSRWEDQRFVGSNPALFSSNYGFAIGDASDPATVIDQLPSWAQDAIRQGDLSAAETRRMISKGKLSMGDPDFEGLILSDPPRHGNIRSVLMKALRPSLVRSLKPRIAEIADEFVAELEPGVETDFVTTIGRIPAALMTELIGVPRAMRDEFIEMASAQMLAITIDPDRDPAETARIQGLVEKFHAYCGELLAERRSDAGEDLVSIIGASEFEGAPVPHGLAISFIHTFVNAGETTRALLSFVAYALAQHPDQRAILAERPELIGNAIEETLRFYPLNWSGCRTATQDVEIGGQQIKKDDYVVMAYASANRDEDVWKDPDVFDVTRSFDSAHQSFGYGEHACPGALLARVDSTTIFERLMAQYPNWELAGPVVRWGSPFLQGISSLPLRFST